MSLGRCETYITPSTTTGVACQGPKTGAWYTHCNSRSPTLAGVIWSNSL